MHVPKKKEAMLLLQAQPQRELVVLTILNGMEVRSTRRLDWINRLCRSRARQKRGRNRQAKIFLHHITQISDSTISVGIPTCSEGSNVEELEALLSRTSSDSRWTSALLQGFARLLHRLSFRNIFTVPFQAIIGLTSHSTSSQIAIVISPQTDKLECWPI